MRPLLAFAVLVTACAAAQAQGTGLTGQYYDTASFGTLKTTRTDATVDFTWGTAIPTGTAITSGDTFSVAWSGQVEPEFTALYTFYVTADDGARLWVNDQLIAMRTFAQGLGEMRGQIRLAAGQRVNVRLEYIEQTGSAAVTLEWSCASRAREVVPTARLYPARVDRAGGSLLKEHWSGLAGGAIGTLTSSPNYPNKPGGREFITSFECLAQDWAESYGTRVTGFIVPAVTGNHTFAVSGDQVAELYLSTDATAANKALIASVATATGYRVWDAQPAQQQSSPRLLVQGQRYYVELLHKENTGADHWSVGWKQPGEAAFSVVPGSALVQPGLTTAQPAETSLLNTLAQEHPRIFATAERFARLRAIWQSATASQPKTWAQNAITSADTILTQAPVAYTQDVRGTILSQARTVVDRMYKLGLAWQLTADPAYAERAWTELSTVAAFPDWHPAHFLDTAEMTHACAIGYDWLYQYWTPSRRDTIRNAIINFGLNAGLSQYTSNVGWSQSTGNNWNMVCNGGLSMGALAVGTESESLTENILNRALNSTRPVWKHFTADNGAWYEGPGYWGYTTEYGIRMFAACEWALGSDFGISATQNVSESGFAPIQALGTANTIFNFADAGAGGAQRGPVFQWMARRYGQPLFAWWENQGSGGALDALWWSDSAASLIGTGAPPDMAFHGEAGTAFYPQEMVTMRGRWNDSRATFIGSKGGEMGAAHGNLDAGTFVLDALGKRWFHDLGGDNYALAGYFSDTPSTGTDRWDYYRMRPEGQNTLTINPSANADMVLDALAPLVAYQTEANGTGGFAIHDLTSAFSGMTRVWRGTRLLGARNQVLVQDEIQSGTGKTVWWFAHFTSPTTTVTLEPDGSAALMQQGAERLWCKIVSGGGTFQIMDAVPLPTSPNPAGQNANTGYRKLAINLTNVTNSTLAVWFVPLSTGEAIPATLPVLTALNTWNIAATSDSPIAGNGNGTLPDENAVDIDLRNYVADDSTAAEEMRFAVGNGVNGTIVLLADGHTARFTPAPGFTGVPQFDFTATDTTADPDAILTFDFDLPDASAANVVPDVSGSGRDGTLDAVGTGTATLATDVPSALGREGRSLDLAENGGANAARLSRVIGTSELNWNTSDWTIAGWFKRRDAGSDDMIWHLHNGDGFGSAEELYLVARGASSLSLHHYPGPDVDIVTTAATPGAWHHFAVVRSGATLSLYLNGTLIGSDSAFTLAINQTYPLIFGGHTDTTATYAPRWFDGRLDELAVFDAALAPAEINTLAGGMTVRHFGGLSATGTITLSAPAVNSVWTNPTTSAALPWSTGGNWQSGATPSSSRGTSVQFFAGQTLTGGAVTSNNDVAGAFQMNSLTLAGTSSAPTTTTISGGSFTLLNNGTLLPAVNLTATAGAGMTYQINTPITLGADATFNATGSGTFVFNGDIGGAGGITRMSSSSKLILAGANSYTGGTLIGAGTLQIGNDGGTGSLGAGDVIDNGTLRFDRTGTLEVPNNISGTGGLQVDCPIGAGTIVLRGTNTFDGGVNVSSGALRITNSYALGDGIKTVTLTNGTTGAPQLRLDGSGDVIELPATISYLTSSNTGAIINEAGNNLVSGNITLTGGGGDTKILVSAGTLTLEGNIAPGTTGRTLQLAGAGSGLAAGTISNGNATNVLNVTKSDAGTWMLAGANTYSGTTTIGTGTLLLGSFSALGNGGSTFGNGTGGTTITAGATLDLNGQQGIVEVLTIRGTGVGGIGGLANTSANPASIAGGLVSSISTTAGGTHSSVPDVSLAGGGGSGATATATLGVSAASFTIAGGTTVYSAAPTVTISGGGGTGATATAVLGAGVVTGITITNTGTGYTGVPAIAFSNGTVTTPGTNPSGTGNATNFLVSGITVTNPGSGYASAPAVAFSSGSGTAATANLSSVILGAATTIGGTGAIAIAPGISGAFALTKAGTNSVTLSGANTYTGSTTVSAGTLVVNGSIPAGSTASVAATGRLAGEGSIAANTSVTGTLAPGDAVGTLTFTGPLNFGSASHLEWELTGNTTAGPGSNFDRINAAAVTVAANAAIDVSLNRPGSAVDFSDVFWATARSWTVLNVASVSGTFTISALTANTQDVAGRPASGYGTFTIQNTATTVNLVWTPFPPMQQWRYTHFLANWNNATVAGDTADPDRDGRTNLSEYMQGTDPNTATSGGEIDSSVVANRLNVFFTRDPSHTDLTITVEGADVLGTWTPLARSVAGAPFTALAGGVTISETGAGTVKTVQVSDAFTVTDPLHQRRFLRVLVQH